MPHRNSVYIRAGANWTLLSITLANNLRLMLALWILQYFPSWYIRWLVVVFAHKYLCRKIFTLLVGTKQGGWGLRKDHARWLILYSTRDKERQSPHRPSPLIYTLNNQKSNIKKKLLWEGIFLHYYPSNTLTKNLKLLALRTLMQTLNAFAVKRQFQRKEFVSFFIFKTLAERKGKGRQSGLRQFPDFTR